MAIQKSCKQCSQQFEITDDDLAFYRKISPKFGGKTFEIPPPTLCYECRLQRRLSWRNERNLFLRKCEKSGKQIVAAYADDSKYKVFAPDEWWKDDWDALSSGRDFNPNRPFFEQFGELQKEVPRIALINPNNENSDYTNQATKNKDCYMSYDIGWSQDVLFSRTIYSCTDVVDSFNCRDRCSFIYECINCSNANNSTNCIKCHDISDCHFCFDIKSCQDCILCSNMQHKQYCIENKQYPKEEYEKQKIEYILGSHSGRAELRQRFEKLMRQSIHKYATMFKCEDCTGDSLSQCKNLKMSFGANRSEDGKYFFYSERLKDSYDDNFSGGESDCELNLETIGSYMLYNCKFMFSSWTVTNLLYCDFCHTSKDCFGCVGVRNKQYCILNKQYSKEDYEKLVAQIIEKMKADGDWGEFFPIELSPFPYNLSLAGDYCPLLKEEVAKRGYIWKDKVDTLAPTTDYEVPEQISETDQSILEKVLVCEASKRPYRIQPQELAFYLKMKLPVPRRHPDQRYLDRFETLNPLKLWHRKCMNEGCNIEFETTYAPDRPEKIYCESCYQKSVI